MHLPFKLEDTGRNRLPWSHITVAGFLVVGAFFSISQIGWISREVLPSTEIIGILGWLTLFFTTICFSKNHILPSAFVFFIFLGLGLWIGAYFEPPSDPTHHLFRTYQYYLDSYAFSIQKKVNFGFWHYSMNGIFLSLVEKTGDPDKILGILNLLNGAYWGLLGVSVYLVSKAARLPDKWAFLSCIVCLCFFGTNKFSFFRYYSYGPTFTNMIMLMLWVRGFFFADDLKKIVLGGICAILLLPVLYVNHIQESAFLSIIVSVWLTALIIDKSISKRYATPSILCTILLLLFVLPQFGVLREILEKIFHRT